MLGDNRQRRAGGSVAEAMIGDFVKLDLELSIVFCL